MASQLPSTLHTYLRRLLPAALLAAAATLGGSAFGDPAIACAEPKKFDLDGYYACVDAAIELNKENKITDAQMKELVNGCCYAAGGKVDDKGICNKEAAAETQPTLPGEAPPPVGATQNPAPPPPPFRNPGAVIDTFTPAPASPG
jgi:hypothetical protein